MDSGIENVREILVVGAGAMGSQIAMVCALAGYRATATDLADDTLQRAETQLRRRLERTVEKGRLSRADAEAAFSRLTLTTGLDTAAARADFVIEAAVQRLDVKREVFARLDAIAPEHAILTTNSSTIVSSQLALRRTGVVLRRLDGAGHRVDLAAVWRPDNSSAPLAGMFALAQDDRT